MIRSLLDRLTAPLLAGAPRSPHWHTLELAFVRAHPTCEGCGSSLLLQVHHVRPFHLFRKDELLWTNLMTLCMGERKCHKRLGHPKGWRTWNPHVRRDAAAQLAAIKKGRPKPPLAP